MVTKTKYAKDMVTTKRATLLQHVTVDFGNKLLIKFTPFTKLQSDIHMHKVVSPIVIYFYHNSVTRFDIRIYVNNKHCLQNKQLLWHPVTSHNHSNYDSLTRKRNLVQSREVAALNINYVVKVYSVWKCSFSNCVRKTEIKGKCFVLVSI